MTEINIAHLRALIEKATPAPWGHFVLRGEFESTKEAVICAIAPLHDMRKDAEAAIKLADADAALIVAAVNNVAALCDEVERLREALEVYADKSNWLDTDDEFLSSFCTDDFDWGWQAARKALGKDE